jgi:hypothetical protein
MANPRWLKRAAASGSLMCCAIGVSLVLAAQASATVKLTVATGDAVQGGTLTLTESVTRDPADPVLATAQMDIIFDTAQIQFVSCQLDPRLTQQTSSFTTPSFPPVASGHRRLRLEVFQQNNHPTATFDSGILTTCTFQVATDAAPGQPVSLTTERVVVGDSPNDNEVPGVQVQIIPGVVKVPTVTPIPTATPTPIPCFFDRDCPLGQVCDPSTKVCVPAPTPTPTIACPDGNCPNGLTCVNGICVDLSTPTPTPTPLPPCMTDADCLQGFHCRAKVCVPIRECDDTDPILDRTNCRGSREACVNGTCECGGDCNVDGFVFGNETSVLIGVLTHQRQLSDCAAGDFNGDGEITGTEVCSAVTNLGLGCPGEGQPLTVGQDRSGDIRSLDVGSASGNPGDNVTIAVNLGGGGDVATAQLDLLFDTAVLEIPNPETACAVDSRLTATDAAFTFLPQTPDTPGGKARLRLFVGDMNLCKDGLSFPVGAFDQGQLLSCTFKISSTAPAGDSALTAERLNVGDPIGNEFGSTSTAGKVTVFSVGTPTATGTPPTPTITGTPPTPTITGTPPTPTITGTPPTPTITTTPVVSGTPATATPTRTNTVGTPTHTVAPGTPTNTPTITQTPVRSNTPSPTKTTQAASSGGGGGGGCAISGPESADTTSALLWIALPAALLIGRRRRVV